MVDLIRIFYFLEPPSSCCDASHLRYDGLFSYADLVAKFSSHRVTLDLIE
ncbi:hypothetical protein A2U01_0109190, partial [Trifolium medium]|nr:hypothetical protein [Trifolium medium]